MKYYYDLNISDTSKPTDIIRYIKCGYTRLAFNQIINVSEGSLEDENKKLSKEEKGKIKSKMEKRLAIRDLSFLINEEVKETTLKTNIEIKIFSRLTLVAKDVNQLKSFIRDYGTYIQKFDILACDPQNADVLAHVVEYVTLELITFDLNEFITGVTRKILKQCQKKNICIEINLSAAMGSGAARINTVKLLNEMELYRCPPILTVTSGARSILSIRNHIGLMSILTTMGLHDKILSEINNNSEKVINKGLTRKHTIKGSAAIIHLKKLPGIISVNVSNTANDEATSPVKKKCKLQCN